MRYAYCALRSLRPPLPHAHPLQARYHLAAEERQLVRIVDEGDADAAQAGAAQIGELAGDAVGIADDRNAAHAVCIIGPLFVKHSLADRRAADVLLGQNEVDCRPVRIVDNAVAIVVLGLLAGRPARDDAHGVDVDLASVLSGFGLDVAHALRRLLGRSPRRLGEERIAVAQRERPPRRRGAGIHDQRPRAAVGLRLGADVGELDVCAVEVEVLLRAPGELYGIEPFLSVFVAPLMIALLDADHLALVLVPSDYEIEPEPAFADMIGGDELLGGDQRIEQWRMDSAEHRDTPGRGKEPARPRHGLESRALIIGIAAMAFPARDRQQKIDAPLAGHAGEAHIVGPASGPAF